MIQSLLYFFPQPPLPRPPPQPPPTVHLPPCGSSQGIQTARITPTSTCDRNFKGNSESHPSREGRRSTIRQLWPCCTAVLTRTDFVTTLFSRQLYASTSSLLLFLHRHCHIGAYGRGMTRLSTRYTIFFIAKALSARYYTMCVALRFAATDMLRRSNLSHVAVASCATECVVIDMRFAWASM